MALVCAVTVDVEALRLSRIQAVFVANVTHELKTPLSVLLGASETIDLGRVHSSPEKLDESLGIVRTEAARLSRFVERILSFSRSEVGLSRHMLETVDVGDLVNGCVASFQTVAGPAVTIRAEVASDVRLLNADRAGLEDVVINLLENAVSYSNGSNEVRVRAESVGLQAVISVQDHGVGIDHADLPHIFDRFYRGHNGGSHHRPGFGLGLAIVQSVVRAHRGVIQVMSEPGSGSEFRVVLPLNRKASYHDILRTDH